MTTTVECTFAAETLIATIVLLSLTLAGVVLSMACLVRAFRIMRRFEKAERK